MAKLEIQKIIKKIKSGEFSKISPKSLKTFLTVLVSVFLCAFLYICFQVYYPLNPKSQESITYTVQKGWGDEEIAKDLKKSGIIRSSYFFQFYVVTSLRDRNLKAGEYEISPNMSIKEIAQKMASGDIIKNDIIILEGWDAENISDYLEKKGVCKEGEFSELISQDYSAIFGFLADKPKDVNLEGYLFPDTYEVAKGQTCQEMVEDMLLNFDKKLTPELRQEISNQKKSIFDVITVASLIEKEVRKMEDKKIVSGILWKRLEAGMPLQLDCTINYITNKNDPSVLIRDTKIDSPYNTYMYKGLPKGPISNPGINSITAALYPTETKFWYYLSDGTTHYSETFEQHQSAKAKYLD